jgi:hypothetical protein
MCLTLEFPEAEPKRRIYIPVPLGEIVKVMVEAGQGRGESHAGDRSQYKIPERVGFSQIPQRNFECQPSLRAILSQVMDLGLSYICICQSLFSRGLREM